VTVAEGVVVDADAVERLALVAPPLPLLREGERLVEQTQGLVEGTQRKMQEPGVVEDLRLDDRYRVVTQQCRPHLLKQRKSFGKASEAPQAQGAVLSALG